MTIEKRNCPNCGELALEEDFTPSFRYATLIECPKCIEKVAPDNVAKISNVISDI